MQMIEIFKRGRWYAMLLLVAVSCTKQDAMLPETAAAVRFSAAIAGNSATTRAAGTQWTAGDKIGIHMTDGMVVTAYQNMPYTAAAGDMYYPQNGSMVGFTAYYPYQAMLQNGCFAVNLADQSNPETLDLLHAITAAQYNKFSTGRVTLPFRHVMSKLVLKTVAGAGFTAADLAGMSVSIAGLNSTATFNTVSGELSNATMLAPIVPRTIMDGSHYEAIVLPAAIAAQSMKVTFTVDGNHYVWDAPKMMLSFGMLHEWTITISRTGITATAGNIAPWDATNPIVEDDTRPVYKIGDYYPDPANPVTAIGVVFSVSNDGKNGLMAGLNQVADIGWENAAGWSVRQTAGNRAWYCPGKNELSTLYNQKAAVNTALAGIAGVELLSNGIYWSSTENSTTYAWIVSFRDGSSSAANKSGLAYARAISAF